MWTVIGEPEVTRYKSGDYKRKYPCRCDCGKEKAVVELSLKKGTSKSCGCYRSQKVADVHTKHGHSPAGNRSGTYSSWQAMKNRCYGSDPRLKHYYQDKGITVCDRWHTFENFLEDMEERPKGFTLERIDNNGNYEPGNCIWASRKRQSSNTRRTKMITPNGRTMCIKDWANELGMPDTTLLYRLDQALDLSTYKRRNHK